MTPKASAEKATHLELSDTEESSREFHLADDVTVTTTSSVDEHKQERKERESIKEFLNHRRMKELEEENEALRKQVAASKPKSGGDGDLKFELEEVKVIINLQEEMKALKELLDRQQLEITQLKRQKGELTTEGQEHHFTNQDSADEEEKALTTSDDSNQGIYDDDGSWKEKYMQIRSRYSQLENDRALGEWTLRNRITSDSLRYNRRLIHWKKANQELLDKAQKTSLEHEQFTQELRQQLQTSAASVLQHTLRELSASQRRVAELEEQLAEAKKASSEGQSTGSQSPRRLSILQYYRNDRKGI